jgi:prevent-host-death family protein
MGAYSIAEAKAHLSALLEQVARGEVVTLTKRGKPVARIFPAGDLPVKPKLDLRALEKFRARLPKSPVNSAKMVRKMRDEAAGW